MFDDRVENKFFFFRCQSHRDCCDKGIQRSCSGSADDGDLTALCLLNLTNVLDTVDHDLLLLGLERQFGLSEAVSSSSDFTGKITHRTFQVMYAGSKSSVVIDVVYSARFGLDRRLFILYLTDLEDAISTYDVNLHC